MQRSGAQLTCGFHMQVGLWWTCRRNAFHLGKDSAKFLLTKKAKFEVLYWDGDGVRGGGRGRGQPRKELQEFRLSLFGQ